MKTMEEVLISNVCTDHDLMLYGFYAAMSTTSLTYDDSLSYHDSCTDCSTLDSSYVFHDSPPERPCSGCHKRYLHASPHTMNAAQSTPRYYPRPGAAGSFPAQSRLRQSPPERRYGATVGYRTSKRRQRNAMNVSSGLSGSFNSISSWHGQVPAASPCSDKRLRTDPDMNSEAIYGAWRSPEHSPIHVSPDVLGPRPQCLGKETSPAKPTSRHRSRSSAYNRPDHNWSSPYLAAGYGAETTKAKHSDWDELSVTPDFNTLHRSPLCCVGLGQRKTKSAARKALAQKFKKFNKEICKADKSSSNTSLKTLAVL